MRREVTIASVRSFETQRGSTRWVVRDADGNESTTFREAIGARLPGLEGKRAQIECHEQRRGQYVNVYLDSVDPVESDRPDRATHGDADPEEAAWQTAVAAAPWLVGEPKSALPPKRLYDKLKPFEEYVADDIEEHQRTRKSSEQTD
ncbi:MAG: hypothetical protein ACTHKL_18985 [Streptosporangiaceae bacterium]